MQFFIFEEDYKYYRVFPDTIRLEVSPDARCEDQSHPKRGLREKVT